MPKAKRTQLPPMGFCMNPRTGEISEVVNIAKSTIELTNEVLAESHAIIKACSQYSHSPKLDKRIANYLAGEDK